MVSIALYSPPISRSRAWFALLTVAFAARGAAVWLAAVPEGRPIAYEHGVIAENLSAGRGFALTFLGVEGPTSQQAPWVPTLLAACYWVFGAATPAAILAFQLLQCVAGTLLVAVAARLAWRMFPERPGSGWAVGWAAALYPPHVYMVTHVQAAVWSALGIALLFHWAADRRAAGSWSHAVRGGAIAGWLLLVDPILALIVPIAGFQNFLNCRRAYRNFSPALRPACVFALTTAALVAPWLLRCHRVHGEFVFVKSTFGYALWQGNNELSWGTDKIPKPSADTIAAQHDGSFADRNRALWEARHETLYIDDVLLKPTGYREFAELTEPQRSRLLGTRAGDWIRQHPTDYAGLCLRRMRYFLLWDETNPKARNTLYRVSSAVWLATSLIGLLAACSQWRVLWPTMLAFFALTAFHALTITSARFRIPIEMPAMLWAAAGFHGAAANIWRSRKANEADARHPPTYRRAA